MADYPDIMKQTKSKEKLIPCLILMLVLVFIIYAGFSSAWTGYTHDWICDKAGLPDDIDCAAADTPAIQSKYPDASFRNHHCTENQTDCSARKIADKYMVFSNSDARGISAHLYADSLVPVHWYSTDYNTCHKIFEDKVEEKIRDSEYKSYKLLGREYDFSEWNISMQCIAKYGKENKTVYLYADNQYMDSVAEYVAEKMGIAQEERPQPELKTYDFTPILILLIILIVILFVLFFYFGMKDRRYEKRR